MNPAAQYRCVACGAVDRPKGIPLRREYRCPACSFWITHAALHGRYGALDDGSFNAQSVRLQGTLYSISTAEAPNGPIVAFRCFDGTLVVTNRLELHGPVPYIVRSLLPDNAVLVPARDLPIGIYAPAHSR